MCVCVVCVPWLFVSLHAVHIISIYLVTITRISPSWMAKIWCMHGLFNGVTIWYINITSSCRFGLISRHLFQPLSLSLLLLTLSMNWLHRNNHQLKCHVPCLTVCIVEWVVFTVYFNTTATHTHTEHIHFQPSHLLIASFIHPIVTDKFLYKVLNNFLSSLLASLKLPKTNINNAKALQHSFRLLLLLPLLLLLLFHILFCRNIRFSFVQMI